MEDKKGGFSAGNAEEAVTVNKEETAGSQPKQDEKK